MGTRLNRETYKQLIDGNIEWLLKQQNCLEREHIQKAVDYEYGPVSEDKQ